MAIPPELNDPNQPATNDGRPPAERHPGMPQKEGDPIRLACKACKTDALIEPATVQVGAAEILGFKCANCGEVYPYARVSMKGRKLRAKLHDLRDARIEYAKRSKYATHDPEYARLVERERAALKAYKREVTKLDPEADRGILDGVEQT